MESIREIRKRTGLSQSQFCAALHIPIKTLQNWEIGRTACPPYVVELIDYRVRHDAAFFCTKKSEG